MGKRKEVEQYFNDLVKRSIAANLESAGQPQAIAILKASKDWNSILADFGECSSSWHLESKGSVFFVKLRWAEFPLKVGKGLDMIGYQKTNDQICVSESKAISTENVSAPVSELVDQLSASRLDYDLRRDSINAYGSRGWLALKLIEARVIPKEDYGRIIDDTNIMRFGFLFHPRRKTPTSYATAIQRLSEDGMPIQFVDYDLEDVDFEILSFVEVLKITPVSK